MKKIIIMILFGYISFQPLISVAVDWPGTGSCSTTLQACIDAQAVGGFITVVAGIEIPGSTFTINKGLTLSAKVGVHPRFKNANISVAPPNNEKTTIKGFDFIGASYISGSSSSGGEINILSNTWSLPDNALNKQEGIFLQGFAANTADTTTINIIGNTILGDGIVNTNNIGLLNVSSYGDGLTRANIIDNHVTVLTQNFTASDFIPAVYLHKVQNGRMDLQVVGNQIRGGDSQIYFNNGAFTTTDQVNIGIISNILSGVINEKSSIPSTVPHSAIKFNVADGDISTTIGNNTMDGVKRTGTADGMGFDMTNLTTFGIVNISILNNIIVNTSQAYVGPAIGSATTVISKNNNFFRDAGSFSGFSLISNDVTIDPQFVKEGINYALKDSSPAIDRVDIFGTSLFYDTGVLMGSPKIDADGLRRYKGPKVDSGAIEWGDRHIVHKVTNSLFGNSMIVDAALNADLSAMPIVTSVQAYENSPINNNNHPIGIYRSNPSWGVLNEDNVNFNTGTIIHVFYPYGTDNGGGNLNGLIEWTKDATTSTGFEIDDPAQLNGNAYAVLFASNYWDGNSTQVYNPHSLEVGYQTSNGKWFLGNSDEVNMPTNAKTFIYGQDASRNVFQYQASSPVVSNYVYIIDHPLLNGNPCALPTVTQSTTWFFGPLFGQNPHHIGVFYSTILGKWEIRNQDFANIDVTIGSTTIPGGRFNVMVDPQQVYECNTKILFSDGFE